MNPLLMKIYMVFFMFFAEVLVQLVMMILLDRIFFVFAVIWI